MVETRTGHRAAFAPRPPAPEHPSAHGRVAPAAHGAATPGAAAAPLGGPAWHEVGRAQPGDALWTTWVAFLGEGGDALYRSLVVAEGAIELSVELHPRPGGGGVRALHRGRCGLPPPGDPRGVDGRAALLLAAADKAVARALGAAGPADRGRAPGRAARPAGPKPGAEARQGPGALAAGPPEARP